MAWQNDALNDEDEEVDGADEDDEDDEATAPLSQRPIAKRDAP